MIAVTSPPVASVQTADGFRVSVLLSGDAQLSRLQARPVGSTNWGSMINPGVVDDVATYTVSGGLPGTVYEYQILDESRSEIATGRCKTSPDADTAIRIGLLSDTHIEINSTLTGPRYGYLVAAVAQLQGFKPDLVVNTGDLWSRAIPHPNQPFASAAEARTAWLAYRQGIAALSSAAGWYNVPGNWDGMNGLDISNGNLFGVNAWQELWPQVTNATPVGDYWSFDYGPCTLIGLNGLSYTPHDFWTPEPGFLPQNWTLGATQLAWFKATLAASDRRCKLVFIHHGPGGIDAGYTNNAIYGFKTCDAVYVGEMRKVHLAMQQHRVSAVFYGHDHSRRLAVKDGLQYVQSTSTMDYAQDSKGYSTILIENNTVTVEQRAVADGSLIASTVININNESGAARAFVNTSGKFLKSTSGAILTKP